MLVSGNCSEVNTRRFKKEKKKLSNTNYRRNRGSTTFAQVAFQENYAEDLCASRRQN